MIALASELLKRDWTTLSFLQRFGTTQVVVITKVRIQNQTFYYTRLRQSSMQRVSGAQLRLIAPGQHGSFQRNAATVVSRWQRYGRFDRPEI